MSNEWSAWTIYRGEVVHAAFLYTREAAAYVHTKRTDRKLIRAVHSCGVEVLFPEAAKGDLETILNMMRYVEPPVAVSDIV